MTKFLVVTLGRCGSNLLCDLLNTHPDIRCYQELLVRHFAGNANYEINRLAKGYEDLEYLNYKGDKSSPDHMKEYLDSVYSSSDKQCVGFKAAHIHLHEQVEIQRYMFNGDVKIIDLQRTNLLRYCVSMDFAVNTKKWHRYAWTRVWPKGKIKMNTEMLVARFENLVRSRKDFNNRMMRCQVYGLTYEEFIKDIKGTVLDVAKFLGVPEREIGESKLRKSLVGDWRQYVENWQEVEKALTGTIFEEFLYS